MGSLPNLHELRKDEETQTQFRAPLQAGQCCNYGPRHTFSCHENRNRITHRYSANEKVTRRKPCHQNSKIIYDDFTLEQMVSYSPISNRSSRNLSHIIRRRDSLNSSIGATSVRRLIGAVRNPHLRCGPVYSRRTLIKNLILLCICHALITCTFLPFLALQGSVTIWAMSTSNPVMKVTTNAGSILLTLSHILAAVSVLLSPSILQKIGTNAVFVLGSLAFCIFYCCHLYPVLYTLVPAYVVLGLALGPITLGRINFLMTISSKISYALSEEDEEVKTARRTVVIRRVARAVQAAQDFGLIFGSFLAALVVIYSPSFDPNLPYLNSTQQISFQCHNSSSIPKSKCSNSSCPEVSQNCSTDFGKLGQKWPYTAEYNSRLDNIFDVDDFGDRLCGSNACPTNYALKGNGTEGGGFSIVPQVTSTLLVGVFIAFSVLAALISAAGFDKVKMYVQQDPLERSEGLAALRAVKETFKDVRLQFAAPLAVFIGMEQAFMYADFSKSYVICTLGVHRLNLVFLSMGLLQSVAACTLSMLLRSIKRYYVVVVGFTFHACLLMVQILWKPISDDPALFYVISAAWGVCNAIWEILNFTLLTGLYADNWEAPFANSLAFRFAGHATAFALHSLLCNWLKLYILGFFMLFSVVIFTWLEIRLENMRKVKNINRL